MKKTIKITKSQLQQIIKEGISKLHKQTLIENRIQQINEEISDISNSSKPYKSTTNNELAQYIMNLSNSLNANHSNEERQTIEQELEAVKGELSYRNSAPENIEDYTQQPGYISEENSEVASTSMLDMLNGYLEAALWTEEDEVGPSNINSDISDNSKVDAYRDVKKFKQLAGGLIAQSGLNDEQIGHDLWLTRNGHGSGFWDRGIGKIGDELSDIAREMGSKSAYVGDDSLIYID